MTGHILFLAHRVPWPPDRGDKIRSHHMLHKLLELAPVHLACFADDQAEANKSSDLTKWLVSQHISCRTKTQWLAGIEALASGRPVSLTSFADKDLAQYVRRTIVEHPIDCIFIFSGQMAQYIPSDYRGRLVMDFADVDSAKFESYGANASGPMAWVNRREGRLLAKFEKETAERANYILFVSSAETELFQKRSGVSQTKLKPVGNGIDLESYNSDLVTAEKLDSVTPTIMFTGQMDYRPNVEAVISFTNEVMPKVRAKHPDAAFLIVGRAPTKDVQDLNGKHGAQVIGPVEDVRTWLKAADIVVAPLRTARGIQNKVLEAMAMSKPVVATAAAAEGIDAVDGKDILVAQNPDDEAKLILKLCNDLALAKRLSESARNLVISKYSWAAQLADLSEIVGIDTKQEVLAAE